MWYKNKAARNYSVKTLQRFAKINKVRGYSKLKKNDLISLLVENKVSEVISDSRSKSHSMLPMPRGNLGLVITDRAFSFVMSPRIIAGRIYEEPVRAQMPTHIFRVSFDSNMNISFAGIQEAKIERSKIYARDLLFPNVQPHGGQICWGRNNIQKKNPVAAYHVYCSGEWNCDYYNPSMHNAVCREGRRHRPLRCGKENPAFLHDYNVFQIWNKSCECRRVKVFGDIRICPTHSCLTSDTPEEIRKQAHAFYYPCATIPPQCDCDLSKCNCLCCKGNCGCPCICINRTQMVIKALERYDPEKLKKEYIEIRGGVQVVKPVSAVVLVDQKVVEAKGPLIRWDSRVPGVVVGHDREFLKVKLNNNSMIDIAKAETQILSSTS